MDELAEQFIKIFDGLKRAYGTYEVTTSRTDGKQLGQAATKRAKVTVELWAGHLKGDKGIGIVPIRDDNTAVFGAIDVDIYGELDIAEMLKKARALKLPIVPCRSKSGGCHLYLFAKEPIAAELMRKRLGEIASLLGYGQSEIFPKQSEIQAERGDIGGWINMPYFKGIRGLRYAVKENGDAYEPEEFIELVKTFQQSAAFFSKAIERIGQEADLPDAPPCLQIMASNGIAEGQRNEALYAFGVYCKKASPDDWHNHLASCNQLFFHPPLTPEEIHGAVRSIGNKDYHYSCNKPPLSLHCNSGVCRTRKHGVGGGDAGHFPSLGQLRKLETEPPIWFWDVDGRSLELTTQQLQTPRMFQSRCMEVLEVMPVLPSAVVWQHMVNDGLANLIRLEAPEDSSSEGLLWSLLEDFCTGRMQAKTKDEVLTGKPWTDVEQNVTWFRMADFMTFLERRHFRAFLPHKITAIFKSRNANHKFVKIRGKGLNLWGVTAFDMPDDILPLSKEIDDEAAF